MIGDETVINLQRTKVYVFSDSVLCFGKDSSTSESNEAWKKMIEWIITDKSYKDYDGINGEPTEFEWNIFPGFTTLQLCGKVNDLLSDLGQTPETFTGIILFMSINDHCPTPNFLASTLTTPAFAKHSSLLPFLSQEMSLNNGPGSEKKWYSAENSPQGAWDHFADEMLFEFAESGHLTFRATTPLSRGQLKSKGHGKLSIHFAVDEHTLSEMKAEVPLQNENPSHHQILWQQYMERIESLSPESKVSKFCMEAGFVHVVEVGQYFMTKDTGDFRQFRAVACREYTLHRDDESSQPRGWIQGNTRVGPVLEVTTSYTCTVSMELKSESGL